MKPIEWRSVVGYEGLYELSEFGDVDSLEFRNRGARVSRRLRMKPHRGDRGYLRIQLSRGGSTTSFGIHELVALTFIGPKPPDKDLVAHWDGNPSNNHYSNLRWATHQENEDDKRRHGRDLAGERNHQAKLTNDQVTEFRRRHIEGEKISHLCREYGVSTATGAKIATGDNYGSVGGPVRPKRETTIGSDNGMAKLAPDSVREIRRLHASKEARSSEIAKRFGIHPNNVRMIIRRDTWAHVE